MSNEQQPEEEQSQLATVLIGILIVVAGFLVYTVFTNQNQPENIDLADTHDTEEVADMDHSDDMENEPIGGEMYVVEDGDTLWKIAEKAYGDGYQWTAIADANGIDVNNASVEVGTELTIPAIGGPGSDAEEETTVDEQENEEMDTEEPSDDEDQPEPTPTTEEPTPTEVQEEEQVEDTQDEQTEEDEDHTPTLSEATTYEVVDGDTLWDIAEQHYGDGHQWHLIFDAAENNIEMYTASNGSTFPLIHAGDVLTIPAN